MAYRSKLLSFLPVVFLLGRVFGSDEQPTAEPTPSDRSAATPAWQSCDALSFSVHFQTGDEDLAQKISQSAERIRTELYRNWLALDRLADWNPQCHVFLHASAQSYADATDYRATSSGYSVTHSRAGRVMSQRIDLLQDGSDLLGAVLPHEVAHVLLSNHFVRRPLPLWAEEGLAVFAETDETRNGHVKNLEKYARRGTLYTAQELMAMREYPAEELRGVFYSQSVSLVEFLINRRGTPQFIEFLKFAARRGPESELKRIYGLSSLEELNDDWLASQISADRVGMSR